MHATLAAALAALAIAAAAPAAAQDKPPAADVALVRELLAASGAERQYEQILSIMLESVRGGFHRGAADALRGAKVDPAKQELAQGVVERFMEELLADFRAEVRRVMPYDRLVEEVYAPVYLRHFTRAELAEVAGFYRTAAGRKLAASEPQRTQDSARLLNLHFVPQLNSYMREQLQNRLPRMIEEVKKL